MFGKSPPPVALAHFMVSLYQRHRSPLIWKWLSLMLTTRQLGNTYSYADALWLHQFEQATGAGLCVDRSQAPSSWASTLTSRHLFNL